MGSYTISVYVILSFVQFVTQTVIEKNFYVQSTSQTLKVISELPSQANGQDYISSLKLFVQYLSKNKRCVDFSMKFALFLLNVNLRSFTQQVIPLPLSLRNDIKYLIDEADDLQRYYDGDVESALVSEQSSDAVIEVSNVTAMYISMLTDDEEWSKRITKLDLELLKEIYSYSYEFPRWDKYLIEVNDFGKWMPSVELSNSCLEMLSKNEESNSDVLNCKLDQACLEMLDYGINFGHALSFKLLYVLLAHLSCRCTVFSKLQDERIRHHLCKAAYRESEFIADNGFKKMELMAEHIAFCTLDGHAQFLRKSWISAIIQHQTPYGYFSLNPLSEKDVDKLRETKATSPDDCLEHINAVVVGALSAALRFVLENYN